VNKLPFWRILIWVLRFPRGAITPPVLHTHLLLQRHLNKRTNERAWRLSNQSCAPSKPKQNQGRKEISLCVISGFRRDGNEICALLGYYAVQSENSVLTFWNNLSVPSSRVKKGPSWPLKMEPIGCQQRWYRIPTLRCVTSHKNTDLSQFMDFTVTVTVLLSRWLEQAREHSTRPSLFLNHLHPAPNIVFVTSLIDFPFISLVPEMKIEIKPQTRV
jgi:hypothetical protein